MPLPGEVEEIFREAVKCQMSDRTLAKRLKLYRHNMYAKDRIKLRQKFELAARIVVHGTAQVETDGKDPDGKPCRVIHDRTVYHPDKPGWWNQAAEDQRRQWLIGAFRRQLRLKDSDRLLNVQFRIGGRA